MIRRILLRTLGTLLAVPVIYLLVALALAMVPAGGRPPRSGEGVTVYVASNGFHTDLFLPIQAYDIDLSLAFPPRHFREPDLEATYLSFGWGDRAFYLNTPTLQDMQFSTTVAALAGYGRTAMHVGLHFEPREGENVKRLVLTEARYRRLVDWLRGWIDPDASGRPQVIPDAGYGGHDAFYEAVGSYGIILTCNEWLRRGLEHVGIRTSLWSPLPFGIMWKL